MHMMIGLRLQPSPLTNHIDVSAGNDLYHKVYSFSIPKVICTSRFLSKRNVSLFRLLESNELRLFELQDAAACNKSKNCSVPGSEETAGWKAGVSVGYCTNCSKAASAQSEEKAKGTKEKTAKARGTKEENHSTKKNVLRLAKKWK